LFFLYSEQRYREDGQPERHQVQEQRS
jgi:hypothetical protein